MRKFLGVIPLYVSSDFIGFTNEFGQYETIANASDLQIAPGEVPHYSVDFESETDVVDVAIAQASNVQESGGYILLESARTGVRRLYRMEQEAQSGWYYRSLSRLPNGEYGLAKIFND